MKIFISLCREYELRPFTGNHGLYSAVVPTKESYNLIEEYFDRAGLKNMEPDLHCTVMMSPRHIPEDLKTVKKFSKKLYRADASRFSWTLGYDNMGVIILELDSPDLKAEHDRLESLGCVSNSRRYDPHITVRKKNHIQRR